jgi:predicted RNase H-like HicB family nuclease
MDNQWQGPDGTAAFHEIVVRGRTYEIVVRLLNGRGYRAECPLLPGGCTEADTAEEALHSAADALLFFHFVSDEHA